MTKDSALDLALEALENCTTWHLTREQFDKNITAIKVIKQSRLAPVQEPVAWMSREDYDDYLEESKVTSATVYNYQLDIPLYTTPTAAPVQEPVTTLFGSLPVYDTPPVQEPVAWTVSGKITDWSKDFSAYQTKHYTRPVYTPPAGEKK
jgi:hypothetical protein